MQEGTYFPKVRRMLLFDAPLILTHFWPASTLLRGHLALATLSSWDRYSNFGALGLRWWGSPEHISPSEEFWSRMSAWRATAFVNTTHRIGFRMSELFRKIDEDFGGSISWNTQPNCRVFDELYTTGLTFYGTAHASTFHQICIHSPTCRTSILEGATFHKMSSCKFLWGNPCKAIDTFYHWDFFPGTTGSRCFSLILLHERIRRRFDCVIFPRLFISWRKLQLSPFTHCPLVSHCQHSPRVLCPRCFVTWFLTTAFLSSFPFLSPKFLFRMSCSILLFTIVLNLCWSGPIFFWCTSILYNSDTVLSFSDSRILSLYTTSKMSSDGIFSWTINFRHTLSRIPEYHHFEEQL